jgi:hypothetical protein
MTTIPCRQGTQSVLWLPNVCGGLSGGANTISCRGIIQAVLLAKKNSPKERRHLIASTFCRPAALHSEIRDSTSRHRTTICLPVYLSHFPSFFPSSSVSNFFPFVTQNKLKRGRHCFSHAKAIFFLEEKSRMLH